MTAESTKIKPKKKGRKRKSLLYRIYQQKYLFIMSVPIVIWLVIFAYIPLFGWSYAFIKFVPGKPVFQSQFVGFKYFIEMFQDGKFYNALLNTVIMASLSIVLTCFILPIIFALLLNEVKGVAFKRIVQTVSYLPHFVSWVVVAGMFIQFLSPQSGIFNDFLKSMNLIKEPINFMGVPKYFYAIITSATVWKTLGWNAIIYISAMAGVDQELYEAAAVDGAGRMRKIWNVTLPGIRPTVVILLVMNIGGLINGGFESQMLFSNGLNQEKAQVLSLYVLNYGIGLMRFSFGTAVGIFTSFVSFALVLIANFISKKTTEQALF
ncbi:putative aldouronate transport system permease protein [Anaerotaenia torta]|uniref:ABC transporter permease n=1 Tax=Anaerotaenia torta TaxID=433293 RepID=UPI003D1A24DF